MADQASEESDRKVFILKPIQDFVKGAKETPVDAERRRAVAAGGQAATPKKLAPREVQYLAFEGGGGKGFAYMGAIEAFLDPAIKIFDIKNETDPAKLKIHPEYLSFQKGFKGIAGASVGAITATLLSCGYTPKEFEVFMRDVPPKFYDLAVPRRVPVISFAGPAYRDPEGPTIGPIEAEGIDPRSRCEIREPANPGSEPRVGSGAFPFLGAVGGAGTGIGPLDDLVRVLMLMPREQRIALGKKLGFDDKAASLIADLIYEYYYSLMMDFGLFSGCTPRRLIDDMIADRTRDKNNQRIYNATFEDHFRVHQIKLVLTGTNLTTGKSVYFSCDTTPFLCVADAVRISMSFPIMFKPVVIPMRMVRGVKALEPLEGMWIDGGVLNNIPIHAFDAEPGGGRRDGEPSTLHPGVLGLRLSLDTRHELDPFRAGSGPVISDFPRFLQALVDSFLGVGESMQIRTPQEEAQTVPIDTGNLQTTVFNPIDRDYKAAKDNAFKAVRIYFNR